MRDFHAFNIAVRAILASRLGGAPEGADEWISLGWSNGNSPEATALAAAIYA